MNLDILKVELSEAEEDMFGYLNFGRGISQGISREKEKK